MLSRIITGGMPLGRDGTDRALESFHSIRQGMRAMNLNQALDGWLARGAEAMA